MNARLIIIALFAILQLSCKSVLTITIECVVRDENYWSVGLASTCILQNDLKSNDVAENATSDPSTVLTSIKYFSAQANRKIPLLPSGLQRVFKTLEGIHVDSTDLSFLDEQVLKELKDLKYLSVINSHLSVIIEGTFSGNQNLLKIDLSGNQIGYINPTVFDDLTKLDYLNLNDIICILTNTENIADTKISAKNDCHDIELLEISFSSTIKDNIQSKELSENCQTENENSTCTADCESEKEEIDLWKNKYNEEINKTLECESENTKLNKDILDLNEKIEELESQENNCDTSNGTCRYRELGGIYSCVANGITIKVSKDQTVGWTGTHASGNSNDAVKSMSIKSQTVELLPINIGVTFKNLENLVITDSNLKIIKKGELKSMSKLVTLEITGNSISSIDSGAFDEIKSLKTLDLSKNNIATLPAKIFESLTNLTSLKLSDNKITKLRYDWISSKNFIELFYLKNNILTTVDRNFIYRLRNAQYIDLNGTGCDKVYDAIDDSSKKFITFYAEIIRTCP